jgi:hypothetical protein
MNGVISLLYVLSIGAPPLDGDAFGPGEEMTFSVSYFSLEAGTVDVVTGAATEMEARQVWPVIVFAETESLFKLYRVQDRFVTFWDPIESRSIGNDFAADEGGHRRRVKVEFAGAKAQVHRWAEDRPPAQREFDIDPAACDMAAAVFRVREMALRVGDVVHVPVFTGQHSFDLVARVIAQEKLPVPAGMFDTLRLDVGVIFQGKLKTTQDIVAWVSDDERHIPVRFDGSFLLGTVSAELTTYRHGLTSPR